MDINLIRKEAMYLWERSRSVALSYWNRPAVAPNFQPAKRQHEKSLMSFTCHIQRLCVDALWKIHEGDLLGAEDLMVGAQTQFELMMHEKINLADEVAGIAV